MLCHAMPCGASSADDPNRHQSCPFEGISQGMCVVHVTAFADVSADEYSEFNSEVAAGDGASGGLLEGLQTLEGHVVSILDQEEAYAELIATGLLT